MTQFLRQDEAAAGVSSLTTAPAFASALLELLPVAVYVCAPDGTILLFNRRAAELWDREPKLGDTDQRFCGAHRLFHPDGRPLPHGETPMAEALRSGEGTRDREVVIERTDGRRLVVSVNIEALRDPAGRIVGAVNCFQDITERKRAEERLAERERQFRDLLDALPAAIYTTDADGRIGFFNRAAAELAGRRPESGQDRWCVSWKLFRPDGTPLPHDECSMAIALKENRPVRGVEAIAERPDGVRFPFLPFPTPLRSADGALIGGVNMLVDMSEQKAAEAKLRESESQTRLLALEVDHRAKNMLANVQALARMTSAQSVEGYVEVFTGRLQALARAHALLSESRWAGADLGRLLDEELAPYRGDGDRVRISGPVVALGPTAAQALAMTVHELATNAAKYGALSTSRGLLEVDWSWRREQELVLHWREAEVPEGSQELRRGFGLSLIERMVTYQLGGEAAFEWRPEGLSLRLRVPCGSLGEA